MSLLSTKSANRAIVLGLFSIVVALFLALPVPSSVQHRIPVLGPNVVWAGSPDETLNPPPTPPKRARSYVATPPSTTRTTLSARVLFAMMWRTYWATVRL